MSGLSFESKDGRIVAAIIDLPGNVDMRAGVSGIDANEAHRLIDNFGKVAAADKRFLANTIQDGINYFEESSIRDALNGQLTAAGVTGQIGAIETITVPSIQPPRANSSSNTSPGDGVSIIWRQNQITAQSVDDNGNRRVLRIDLAGLSMAEANKFSNHLWNNENRSAAFDQMLASVAADGQLKPAERALVNNNTEQAMIRAGVTADVESITVSTVPSGPRR